MVPALSHRVSRVPWYSGSCSHSLSLRLRGSHPLWPSFPGPFCWVPQCFLQSEPRHASHVGLGSSGSARRYSRNHFCFLFLRLLRCFSSPGSPPYPIRAYLPIFSIRIHGVSPCGFPHSDIRGSLDICSSPRLFAACHVFLRLSVPRHPPCALSCLTFLLVLILFPALHSVAARYSLSLCLRVNCFAIYSCLPRSDLLMLIALQFTHIYLFYLSSKPAALAVRFPDRYLGCLHCFFGSSVFGFQGTMSVKNC